MDDRNILINLTHQIACLIKSYEHFRIENSSLRQKLVKLTQERAELIEKNNHAADKIKRILSQLKEEVS